MIERIVDTASAEEPQEEQLENSLRPRDFAS